MFHPQSNETHEALEAATNGSRPDDRFTLADLDAKAATALRIRFDLGLFDPVTEPGHPDGKPLPPSLIDGPTHRKVARDATAASVVLLANQGNLLPLAKSAKIAAIGPYVKPSLQPSMNGHTK
jgi:beta-glucosidase